MDTNVCSDNGLLIDLFIEIIADMYRCTHLLHDDGIIPAKIDDIIKQWIQIIPSCNVSIKLD
jgi:hypothetical protein